MRGDPGTLLIVLVTGTSLGLLIWLGGWWIGRRDPFRERLERIADEGRQPGDKRPAQGAAGHRPRRKSVKDTLAEIEEAQKKRSRLTLRLRLRQAGLDWRKSTYHWLGAGLGFAVLLLTLSLGLAPLVAAGFAFAAGIALPGIYLRWLRARRLKRLTAEFPNAVDTIVRGVKSGLPFPDCLRIVAAEAQEPLRAEFAHIVRDQAVGLTTVEAVERFAERVPLAEARFFAIVISIQSRTGGRLSESLGNLATVLRERKKMRGKIKAMSAEAKASGGIIGSLPVVVAGVVWITSPDYISLLFSTLTGNLVIGACVVWMSIGVFVMRRMIAFDF